MDEAPHCVSALSCVPKKGGNLRLVIDLRPLNEHIKCPYFKNEGIDTVCELIEAEDKLFTLDLKSGFHHVSIHNDYRIYLGFQWNNKFYVWNVLPFGLNASPYFFNKVLRPIIIYLRSIGLRCVMWVDDLLQMCKSNNFISDQDTTLDVLRRLGLVINFEKSSLNPDISKVYIGYIVTSVGPTGRPWLKILHQRINKLRCDIKRALGQGYLKARFLAQICGQCVSFTKAIVPTKLLLQNLNRLLQQRASWEDVLVFDNSSICDLNWWLSAFTTWNGREIDNLPIEKQILQTLLVLVGERSVKE